MNTCGVSQTLDAVLDNAAIGYLRARNSKSESESECEIESESESERERESTNVDGCEIRRRCRR